MVAVEEICMAAYRWPMVASGEGLGGAHDANLCEENWSMKHRARGRRQRCLDWAQEGKPNGSGGMRQMGHG
ncbi:hypothetical protein GUJ93_ZPchr0007g3338 [Zizania palustris]|uniref:Uncharacterized protein n=1 Tax=Zizania palustris TaxID=103762 RepID=A0A8J5T346_ZIZPA|nr:hypothetical protein GUJ93_ZPchr0007g3338 [Zizania palustris]